jgi:hypothetical protein
LCNIDTKSTPSSRRKVWPLQAFKRHRGKEHNQEFQHVQQKNSNPTIAPDVSSFYKPKYMLKKFSSSQLNVCSLDLALEEK